MSEERLGDRVRKFREMKRLSVEDLAGRSGLDARFLKDVEEHRVIPSLGALLKVSRAIGIRLANFLDDEIARDPLVFRTGEHSAEHRTELGSGPDVPESLIFYSLGKGKIDRHMEPFFIEVLPQPAGRVKVSRHEGEEFIAVISGQIELQVGSETTILGPGDTAYYGSDVPHRLVALNDKKAEIYAVLYFAS